MRWLHELIEYAYGERDPQIKQYILEQAMNTSDNNKGYMWEYVLNKAMHTHTTWLGGRFPHMDYTDTTDAKIGTFYRRKDGVWEASIGNIRTKVGPLRVCLVVPGENLHRLYFLFIPHAAYQKYTKGSDALKITLNAKTNNISGELTVYQCTFEDVVRRHSPSVVNQSMQLTQNS